MSDHTWEDYVEPGFQSAKWVLEMLHTELVTLDDNDCGNHDEFRIAGDEIENLRNRLIAIQAECKDRREK